VRGTSPEHRRTARTECSLVIEDLHQYFEARNRQISAKSKPGEAIRYALTRWDGLTRSSMTVALEAALSRATR